MLINLNPAKQPSREQEIIARKIRDKIKAPCNRILLIHPQQVEKKDFSLDAVSRGKYSTYPPYGCGVLARNLSLRGYQADILDLNFELLFAARKENFDYYFWKELLKERLKLFKPELVGISCMFSMSHEMMKEIAHETREYDHNLPIICGGVHLSDSKKLALEDLDEIDFMGVYECDRSFPDLIDFINGKLPAESLTQIGTMVDGQYVAIEDRAMPTAQEMDVIPLYCDLPIEIYSDLSQVGNYEILTKDRPVSSVSTNRGCRAHCSFCTVPSLSGKGVVRLRSIQGVIEEIKTLYSRGIRHIDWLDDDLLYDSKRITALFQAIADLKLDLTWSATNGLIAAAIKEDIMEAMITSGCVGFNLGIESGNPQRLKDIHKPGTVEGFRKCKKITDKYPQLFIRGYLIIGFPGETVSEFMDTVNLGLELQLDWYNLQILNPLPTTEIYNSMVEQGLIEDTLNTHKSAYIYGRENSKLRLREKREGLTASEFFDLFNIGKPEDLIKPEHLDDYQLLMQYKLNYEVVFRITNEFKLRNKDMFFADVCERVAPYSVLDQLFYGITRKKLGDDAEASRRAKRVRELLEESAFWQKRFEALDLYPFIEQIA
ncbi:MAG: radical SAM protein [bacterium]|nr:radical SAM protein [bacterium]